MGSWLLHLKQPCGVFNCADPASSLPVRSHSDFCEQTLTAYCANNDFQGAVALVFICVQVSAEVSMSVERRWWAYVLLGLVLQHQTLRLAQTHIICSEWISKSFQSCWEDIDWVLCVITLRLNINIVLSGSACIFNAVTPKAFLPSLHEMEVNQTRPLSPGWFSHTCLLGIAQCGNASVNQGQAESWLISFQLTQSRRLSVCHTRATFVNVLWVFK